MSKSKTDQAPEPRAPMTLDKMTCELAAYLRDAIEETDLAYLETDPQDAFQDLACRLIFRLRATLTVVPAVNRAKQAEAAAAARIFDIFTRWLRADPERSYDTRISASGKFQLIVRAGNDTKLFFGGSVQDAYAQAAQTIDFNGGTL